MGKLIAVWVGTRRAEHTLGHCGPSFTEFSNYLWARFEAPRKTQGRGARQPLRRGEGGRRAGGRRRSRPWCPSIRPSRRPRPTHHHSAPSPSPFPIAGVGIYLSSITQPPTATAAATASNAAIWDRRRSNCNDHRRPQRRCGAASRSNPIPVIRSLL